MLLLFVVYFHAATYAHQVRSSCLEVFCKNGVLKNFAKFTGKHLCQILFFNKVAGLRPQNTFFLKIPPVAASVQLYRILMNSKPFLLDFQYWFQHSCYAEQFLFRVTFSSYLSDQLIFEIAIFLKSYFPEQLFFITTIYCT